MNLCCNLSTVIIYVDTWWTLLELFHVLFYQVKKDSATYSETPVEISGSDDAIKKAKELIEQIISPQSSIISSMGGTCYKFLKLHCCYIKLTLGESLLCIEQHAKKAVSDSPGASGFDIGILLHKPSQFLTVVWGSSATCFFYLVWYFAWVKASAHDDPILSRSSTMVFYHVFLGLPFFSSSLWYPDHNLGRLRNSLCGQSGRMTKL